MSVSCESDPDSIQDCEAKLQSREHEASLEHISTLGLSISKQICEKLSGDLTVKSRAENRKAVFTFSQKCLKLRHKRKRRSSGNRSSLK